MPTRHSSTLPMNIFRILLASSLLALAALPATSLGASPFEKPPAPAFAAQSIEEEFLPVEEAYQLSVEVSANKLHLIWQIAEGYYLYGHRFQFAIDTDGQVTQPSPQLPPGKHKIDEYFGEVEVYYHQLEVPLTLTAETSRPQTLLVSSQGCADAGLCYPPYKQRFSIDWQNQHAIELTKSSSPGIALAARPENLSAIDAAAAAPSLLWIILFAIAGGAILNLMPCVFPVLTLKVMSFSGKDPGSTHARLHGLVYTAGVIISFVAVAALLLTLRAGGEAIGWGFHLQSPWFVAVLIYLFFTMGLALSGMLEIGSRFMGLGSSLAGQSGYSGTFFTGVLAVVVASPCTAPFMGTALGYAMTQPTATALGIFAALGFGMAAPFLLLTEIPMLTKVMPKPGAWMDSFKRFMAFPLYATCIWLLWVVGNQVGSNGMATVLLGCMLIAMAVYLWHEQIEKPHWRLIKNALSLTASVTALALLGSPLLQTMTMKSPETNTSSIHSIVPYSDENLAKLRSEGKVVFLDVTADWCITCLANEKVTLNTATVQQAFQEYGVIYMVADWTNYDPQITRLLHDYGRSGIPLYLLFPADTTQKATMLPQLLSTHVVLEALKQNAQSSAQNKNLVGLSSYIP